MRRVSALVLILALSLLGSTWLAACSSADTDAADATDQTEAAAATAVEEAVPREEQYVLQNVPAPTIEVTSAAVGARGGKLNKSFTCEGANVSPDLSWSGAPTETQSYVVLLEDHNSEEVEGEGGGIWTHWILYSIPPDVTSLVDNISQTETLEIGAKHGLNDYENSFYSGPCPRPTLFVRRTCPSDTGSGCGDDRIYTAQNRPYYFHVYALDKEIDLAPGASRNELLQEVEGHILAAGVIAPEFRSTLRCFAHRASALTHRRDCASR